MRRRDFIKVICGAAASWPFAVSAQEPGRTYRLGGLSPSPRETSQFVALSEELRRSGFIEGQNLTIDWRGYGQRVERVSEFAAELVKARMDVVFAGGDIGIRAVQRATTTIPIVGFTDDMLGAQLVSSLARPSGNTTGTSLLATELDGKRQEILIEAVPGLRRMAAFADIETTSPRQLQGLQEAARARGVELSIYRVCQSRRNRAGDRCGEGFERCRTQCAGVAYSLRQSPGDHRARCDAAAAGDLPMAGSGRTWGLDRVRPAARPALS